MLLQQQAHGDVDLPSKFSNSGSIANTRHNLTQRQASGGGPSSAMMNPYRNDYNEVCVYCHTPHGANTTIAAPLWNRTIKPTTYTVYNLIGSQSTGNTVTQPGANSLTCLSCHDGQVAVDSIINMPGPGRYSASQMTAQSDAFLNAWKNSTEGGGGGPDATVHMSLGATGCLACHSPGAPVGAGATDLRAAAIGTDLRDDHPVGVRYPDTGPNVDFNAPTATRGNLKFFDANGNGRADKGDVRLYETGEGFEVECATCHDPHGVPSGGSGSQFLPNFLRVTNAGSALCLTCHIK